MFATPVSYLYTLPFPRRGSSTSYTVQPISCERALCLICFGRAPKRARRAKAHPPTAPRSGRCAVCTCLTENHYTTKTHRVSLASGCWRKKKMSKKKKASVYPPREVASRGLGLVCVTRFCSASSACRRRFLVTCYREANEENRKTEGGMAEINALSLSYTCSAPVRWLTRGSLLQSERR